MSGEIQLSEEAQELLKTQHNIFIGSPAPDFTAQSQLGPIHWHEYLGNSWGVLFSRQLTHTTSAWTDTPPPTLLSLSSPSAPFSRLTLSFFVCSFRSSGLHPRVYL